MRLQKLTGLERDKVLKENEELNKLIKTLKDILSDKDKRMNIIKDELTEIKERYGDERKSEIEHSAAEFTVEDMIPDEDMVITFSHEGYVKRTSLDEYRTQSRGGVGAKGVKTKDDDFNEHRGESPNELGDRIFRTVERIRDTHPGENLIIVSHGAAIAHYLAKALQTRPAFGHQYLMHNAGITELAFDGINLPELVLLNQYKHLSVELQSDPMRRDQHVPE